MSDQSPRPLDYAPPPEPNPWPTWAILLAMFLWPIIVLGIWVAALVAPVFTVLGIINLFHPFPGPWSEGKHALHSVNVSWVIRNAMISAVAIPLAIWHWRWRRRNRQP